MYSEQYRPRKASEYCALRVIQLPMAGIFEKLLSLVNKSDCVDLLGLSHPLDKQPEREERQSE